MPNGENVAPSGDNVAPDEENVTRGDEKLRGYKRVCLKLGFMMCFFFLCRLASEFVIGALSGAFAGMGETSARLLSFLISTALIYALPLLFTVFLFGSVKLYKGRMRELYKKPRRLARSLGTFPAVYGFGYGLAFLTLAVSFIISKLTDAEGTKLEEILAPTTMEPTTNVVGMLLMVFSLVVIAPVAEEFWVRGIVYGALKPYGTGTAIVISAILFGLLHGSVYMLFYTTAIGLALGYVRYATDSLFAVTIIHALVNSVAAGMFTLSSLAEMLEWENKLLNSVYVVYVVAMVVLVFAGVAAFAARIPAIRRYSYENPWTDVRGGKKIALFILCPAVIVMAVLAFDEHAGHLLLEKIGFVI
jgi:membrane protease YdiL (CAAX protease family)